MEQTDTSGGSLPTPGGARWVLATTSKLEEDQKNHHQTKHKRVKGASGIGRRGVLLTSLRDEWIWEACHLVPYRNDHKFFREI